MLNSCFDKIKDYNASIFLKLFKFQKKCLSHLYKKIGSCIYKVRQVFFDQFGKIDEQSITHEKFIAKPSAIKKIMLFVMQRFGQELSWKNATHVLACNAIDYHFSKDSQEPLQWHCDTGEAQAKYSFITLLSDPSDTETGWSGGNLLYTTSRALHRPENYDERSKLCDLIDNFQEKFLISPMLQYGVLSLA